MLPLHALCWKYPCSPTYLGCGVSGSQTAGAGQDGRTDGQPDPSKPRQGQQHWCRALLLPRAGHGKTQCFIKRFGLRELGLAMSHPCRSHNILLKLRFVIWQPLVSVLSSAGSPLTDVGEAPPSRRPFGAKRASAAHLEGGFVSATDELTALLIRCAKSFGIRVLSKCKMIKVQLCTKSAVSFYFLF